MTRLGGLPGLPGRVKGNPLSRGDNLPCERVKVR